MNGLLAELQAATDEKTACQEEKDRTNLTIELANRLVGGLSSEKHRWTDSIALFRELEKQLPGDVLLISAFVSYAGAFDKKYRVDLEQNIWIPYVSQLEVMLPLSYLFEILKAFVLSGYDVGTHNNINIKTQG